MGAQLGISEGKQLDLEAGLAFACMMSVKEDASPMVRRELVVVISCVVREWRGWLVCAAWLYHEELAYMDAVEAGLDPPTDVVGPALGAWLSNQPDNPDDQHHDRQTLLSSFKTMFETLQELSVDPNTEVALMASTVVDYIIALLLDSAFARVPGSAIARLAKRRPRPPRLATRQPSAPYTENGRFGQQNGTPPPLTRTETSTSIGSTTSTNGTMKRSSSVANALRSLASMTGLMPNEETEEKESPVTPPAEITEEPSYAPRTNSTGYTSPYPDPSHPRTFPEGSMDASASQHARARATSGLAMSSASFDEPANAFDVLEALVAEDMERCRLRRNRGTEANADHEGRMNNNGLARPTELTLGMVAKEVKDDVLPLKSGFYDWAVEYYREPQMKVCPPSRCLQE
jgi:regulator-associated protein of mTOR